MEEMWVLFFVFKTLTAGVKGHKYKIAGWQHQRKTWFRAKLCNTEGYGSKACWVEHRWQKETRLVWTVWPWVNAFISLTSRKWEPSQPAVLSQGSSKRITESAWNDVRPTEGTPVMGIFVSRCFIEIINYVSVWFFPGKDSDFGGGFKLIQFLGPVLRA